MPPRPGPLLPPPVRAATLTNQNTFDRFDSTLTSGSVHAPNRRNANRTPSRSTLFNRPSSSPCHRLRRHADLLFAASDDASAVPKHDLFIIDELREGTSLRSLQPTCYQRAPCESLESRAPTFRPSPPRPPLRFLAHPKMRPSSKRRPRRACWPPSPEGSERLTSLEQRRDWCHDTSRRPRPSYAAGRNRRAHRLSTRPAPVCSTGYASPLGYPTGALCRAASTYEPRPCERSPHASSEPEPVPHTPHHGGGFPNPEHLPPMDSVCRFLLALKPAPCHLARASTCAATERTATGASALPLRPSFLTCVHDPPHDVSLDPLRLPVIHRS